MKLTDSIGDMLTRIRNGIKAKKEFVDIPASIMKTEIAKVLFEEGFISKYENVPKKGKDILRVIIKYTDQKKSVIEGLKRVSTPGRRVYSQKNLLPKPFAGFGISIISTSKGIMTGEEAKKAKLGGEVICLVW